MFVLCFVVFGLTLFFMGRASLVEEQKQNMISTAEEVERTASAFRGFGGLNSLDLRMNISAIARSTGNHIFLCDPRGTVVNCSDFEWNCSHMFTVLPTEICQTLESTGHYEALTDLDGFYDRNNYVLADVIVTRDDRFLGYVFVSYDPSGFSEVWGQFITLFSVVSVLVLVAAVLLEWLSTSRRTRPLKEMARAAHSFSRGNFSARVEPYQGEDEIAELTASFNSMAEALERNESLRRELIANVAHELRTPMTSIAGFADGLLDGTIPTSDESKYLQTISTETKRLSRLVRSMLDMSQLQENSSGDFSIFDHSELLLQTLLNFEGRINEKQLEVDLDIPEDHLMAFGSRDAITRVVYNLLDNAVKFSDPGSTLRLRLWAQNERLFTSIADRGEPIAPEELPLIFDRFHKTDRSRSRDRDGVGLGLYMVKSILDSHDQEIFVTSENGETVFTFSLTEAEA